MEINCKICKVRSWKISDIDSLSYHANNRKIWLNLRDAFPFPYSKQDAEIFIKKAHSMNPETYFAIDLEGKAVGSIGFRPGKDIEKVSAEIGYWLGEEFWGKGIVTASLKGLTPYAIQKFRLSRVFAVPFADNPASFRVLEKAGYVCEGIMRKSCIKDGKIKDQLLYAFVV